jgi:hypothetical protein
MCLSVVLWSVAFTAFYSYVTFSGSWAQAFYYTVQAGLSIGFGVLGEAGPVSLWTTILNVLLG